MLEDIPINLRSELSEQSQNLYRVNELDLPSVISDNILEFM